MCVCVCVCARARVFVYVCVYVYIHCCAGTHELVIRVRGEGLNPKP
jgi:hypothetical protein